ncbi:carboxymuconolactone decarboxylase family protein [Nitratireductor sp. ZSWI3]|uniref:carboxymuconolactone decarboxylase family protein n=1 Tax=Nitratireductor sp. ZSWI3 TaxID=2966359 RepID=UPI00214FD490|nr:carboxymuconolactone decarboxylase family protein [Nitratireductor sp. ZSWI3]MCR4265169.1 carboxymuconolactone decarboxylase family protein [Nitratireductor sp. ZSWI3]
MSNWPEQRLGAPDSAGYSARQKEIHEAIASGPRGGVRGPLAVWLHRPELAAKAQELGRYCRYDTTLDPRLSELAILVTGRIFGSEYEWQAHKEPALKAGLAPEIIDAICRRQEPVFTDPEEALVYDLTCAAHERRQVDDALYARAVEVLGEQRLVDLVGLLGYYTLISLTINIFRIPPLGDAEPEFVDE